MSWVFLTDRSAYKLKKPIRYHRLDFTTLAKRRFYCEEEIRLNRRLAGDVYHSTMALTREDGGALSLGGRGHPIDWLVHMRRVPEGGTLEAILTERAVKEGEVQAAADRLAAFFSKAHRVSISSSALCQRLAEGIREDRHELSRPEFELPRERVEAIASSQLAFLETHEECFSVRARDGRIVEGHGDLRPEHICLTPKPIVIDCLEFCQELRELDPADELAFLALECERLNQAQVGAWFRKAYERRSGDRIPPLLLAFYRNYRILRRAKIAAWHLREPGIRAPARFAAKARRYLELADQSPRGLRDLGMRGKS